MTFTELIDEYTDHLRAINRAATTIKVRASHLRRFRDYASGCGVDHPSRVTASIIHAYQRLLSRSVNARGNLNSPELCNRHLAALKGFFRYLKREDHTAHDPAAEIEYATQPKRLPSAILTPRQVRKILRRPDTRTVLGFRDRTILEVFYSTAIRRRELIRITIDDVNLEAGLLTIRQGKGMKDRVVPLGKIACRYIETYLNGIRPDLVHPDRQTRALFLSRIGRRMDPSTVKHLVAKHARAAGIKARVTPHVFRHSCATHMLQNRANIRHIQELLGHNQLTTTQKYVRVTITDLQEAHRRHHPREKDR